MRQIATTFSISEIHTYACALLAYLSLSLSLSSCTPCTFRVRVFDIVTAVAFTRLASVNSDDTNISSAESERERATRASTWRMESRWRKDEPKWHVAWENERGALGRGASGLGGKPQTMKATRSIDPPRVRETVARRQRRNHSR